MNKQAKTYLIFAVVVTILLVLFRPVPPVEEDNALQYQGVLKALYKGNDGDLVFQMEDGMSFYIEDGYLLFNADSLAEIHLGNKVLIKYPDYKTFLNPEDSLKHASFISSGGELIYTEF